MVSSPADYFYLAADDRPTGIHFPHLFADHGIVGKASNELFLPSPRNRTPATGFRRRRAACPSALPGLLGRLRKMGQHGRQPRPSGLYHISREPPPGLPDSLVQAIAALSDFIEEYPVQPDILNPHNLMMRADGTLVLSDPVFLP
jgi:hypothetical protein